MGKTGRVIEGRFKDIALWLVITRLYSYDGNLGELNKCMRELIRRHTCWRWGRQVTGTDIDKAKSM